MIVPGGRDVVPNVRPLPSLAKGEVKPRNTPTERLEGLRTDLLAWTGCSELVGRFTREATIPQLAAALEAGWSPYHFACTVSGNLNGFVFNLSER